MGKIFALGKYNKLYKYIWIYIVIRVINEYFFGTSFPTQWVFKIFEPQNYPPTIIIQEVFNYFGAFIFSLFLNHYEKKQMSELNEKEIFHKNDMDSSNSSNKIEYIYVEQEISSNISPLSIIFPIIFSIISEAIMFLYIHIGLEGLDIWVFDLFFMAILTKIIFDRPVYAHRKIAISILIIFSTLFKLISTFLMMYDNNRRLLYQNHAAIIPFGIIAYILLSLLRNYTLCKIKWLLDVKYVTVSTLLITYNLIGTIIFLIVSFPINFKKCADKEEFDDIDLICHATIEKDNKIEYYFDEYTYFFNHLWQIDKIAIANIFYLILFSVRIFLNFLRILYSILIIKHLSPEFYLCPACIYFLIIKILDLINRIIGKENISPEIFNIMAEFVSIFGTMIFLELIELKFLNLNLNIRKNIELRSMIEYQIFNTNEEDENES